jgi:hypothetical protein
MEVACRIVADHRDRRNLEAPRRNKQGAAGVGSGRDVAQLIVLAAEVTETRSMNCLWAA